MSQHHLQRWHDVVAERAIGWEDGPEGGAVLLVPRFRRGPLARWLQPRLRRPYMRVKLDEIGSFAWRMMDGKTRLETIAEAMQGHFGERVEPAANRLKSFYTILYKDGFVKLFTPQGEGGR
jgi:hypothetical protein